MNLLSRWIVSSLSLVVAAWLVPGIHVEGNALIVYVVMAVILGLVNSFVRPIFALLSLPLTILTIGLFILVINALMLWLSSAIAVKWFHLGFFIDGFWSAFLGAVIVSITSMILSVFVKD